MSWDETIDKIGEKVIFGAGVVVGVLVTIAILSNPVNKMSRHEVDARAVASDLKVQLRTCNAGREEFHHQVHVLSDSLAKLRRHR